MDNLRDVSSDQVSSDDESLFECIDNIVDVHQESADLPEPPAPTASWKGGIVHPPSFDASDKQESLQQLLQEDRIRRDDAAAKAVEEASLKGNSGNVVLGDIEPGLLPLQPSFEEIMAALMDEEFESADLPESLAPTTPWKGGIFHPPSYDASAQQESMQQLLQQDRSRRDVPAAIEEASVNDDLENDFTETLFESLKTPNMFPNPREIGNSGNVVPGDIEPGLLPLQPSFEEIMAALIDEEFDSADLPESLAPTAPWKGGIVHPPSYDARAQQESMQQLLQQDRQCREGDAIKTVDDASMSVAPEQFKDRCEHCDCIFLGQETLDLHVQLKHAELVPIVTPVARTVTDVVPAKIHSVVPKWEKYPENCKRCILTAKFTAYGPEYMEKHLLEKHALFASASQLQQAAANASAAPTSARDDVSVEDALDSSPAADSFDISDNVNRRKKLAEEKETALKGRDERIATLEDDLRHCLKELSVKEAEVEKLKTQSEESEERKSEEESSIGNDQNGLLSGVKVEDDSENVHASPIDFKNCMEKTKKELGQMKQYQWFTLCVLMLDILLSLIGISSLVYCVLTARMCTFSMVLINAAAGAYTADNYKNLSWVHVLMMVISFVWFVFGASADNVTWFCKSLMALICGYIMANDNAKIIDPEIEQIITIETESLKAFGVFSYNDVNDQITITKVKSGSSADQKGLKKGDEIVQLNGMVFDGVSQEFARTLIKGIRGPATMILRRKVKMFP